MENAESVIMTVIVKKNVKNVLMMFVLVVIVVIVTVSGRF